MRLKMDVCSEDPNSAGFGWKPCLYFARGYCKNGTSCRFLHGGLGDSVVDDGGQMAVGSPSKLEMIDQSCHEALLRSKTAQQQQQRLAAASQLMASANSFPYSSKCMNFLLQQQQTDAQRAASAAALMMGDDMHKFSRSRLERTDFWMNDNGAGSESLTDSSGESRESSSSRSSSETSTEEVKRKGPSSPPLLGWPIRKAELCKNSVAADVGEAEQKAHADDSKFKDLASKIAEMDMMRERFSKLLLGEDMSGSGKGVCTAMAISNAITNLCASIFGQLWRLEPLPAEKKSMWRREMEWLICVSDHIVELIPSWQTFPDGKKLEVMTCRPRSDLFMNLPALRKLDNMLLDILDSFTNTEFWYVDQGVIAPEADGSASFRKTLQRQEEKWWLPVPRVAADGLSENSRKQLHHTRECTNQILKAAMAINSITLAEMEVPESYMETLPKNGRACLGDISYRYITSDKFSPEFLLDCLDLSSEHVALEIANRVEASIFVWRRRAHSKPMPNPNRSTTKSSWEMVKDLVIDVDKRELLAERAESLLLSLKQRFPCLTQTILDTSKIQCNKDVGKSILESYSRVLESLAFNIVARIDDLLYVDDLAKQTDRLSSVATVSVITRKKVPVQYSVPPSSTPQKRASANFSPVPLISPARGERTPFLHTSNNRDKPPRRGLGVRRVLTNYLGVETKARICSNTMEGSVSIPNLLGTENLDRQKDSSHQNGRKSHQVDR